MCCIFTCCGWMIDLVQRLWTFTMSCCISSAVCCALLTASMSGIAMGYNYSLAEYIDLKETNVSVYLKRGVFDDEVADDMDWRRSGHLPVSGHLRDSNLVTGEPDEESVPVKSGRRLDDSVFQSDDHNKFEGSLMKLTAKPPDATSPKQAITSDEKMAEIIEKYPSDSLNQLKAIHSLINMRKANEHRSMKQYEKSSIPNHTMMRPDGRRVIIEPDSPDKHNILVGDKNIPLEPSSFKINPARLAVPDESIAEAPNWFLPKIIPPSYKRTMLPVDYDNVPNTLYTYPPPIRYKTDVQRPTRVRPVASQTMSPIQKFNEDIDVKESDTRRLESSVLNRVQNKLLMDKANFPSFRKAELDKYQSGDASKSDDVDYEDDANKGLPVRQKRNIKVALDVLTVILNYTGSAPHTMLDTIKKSKNENRTDILGQNVISGKTDIHFKAGISPKNNYVGNTDSVILSKRNFRTSTLEWDSKYRNNFNKILPKTTSDIKVKKSSFNMGKINYTLTVIRKS